MTLTVQLDGEARELRPETTAAELFAELHPDVAPNAPGYWILAREDGSKYIENPQRKGTPVAELWGDGEPMPIYLEQPEKCRHGSPAIRNRGFLCGRC